MCLRNLGEKEGFTKRNIENLIHNFSKLSKNYNEGEVDDWITTHHDKIRESSYGWNYLCNTCIKEDNPAFYEFGFMRVGEYFYDVLSQLWSEAYLFNQLILVGFLGCTVQLLLEDVWTVFFSALLFRVLGIVIVSINYQALAGPAVYFEKYETTLLLCLSVQLYSLVQIFLVVTDSDQVWNSNLFAIVFGLSYAGGYAAYVFNQGFFHWHFKFTSPRDNRQMQHKETVHYEYNQKEPGQGGLSTHNSYFQGYFLLFLQLLWAWDVLLHLVFVLFLLTGSGDSTLGAVKGALSNMSPYVTSAMYTEIAWSASGGAFA